MSVCAPRSISQAGPGHEAGRELERRAASRECSPRSPGRRLGLGALRRSLPRAGVTSTSRGGQAGRSARARLAGRGSGRGAASTRARSPRAAWAAASACHCCGAAGRSLEGSGGGGGSRHLRRRPPGGAEMWPLAAALLLGSCCCGEWLGDPGSRAGAQHPGAPAGVWAAPPPARRRPEESREKRRGWRDARALRTRSATVGGPGGASAPLPPPCALLPLVPVPPSAENGLKLLTLQRAHVGRLGTTATVQTRTAKKARGQLTGTPPSPLLSHPSLFSVFHAAFGVEGLESGRTGPLVMKCAFW